LILFIASGFDNFQMQFPFRIPDGRRFDAVGFGTNAVDFLIEVPEYPDFNSKVELSDYTRAAGGEAASTMVGLARLGMRTSYAGRFGDDEPGAFGLESLRQEGVDVTFSSVVAGARTQIAFILIDERTGERTVIWHRDKKLAVAAGDAPVDAAVDTRIIHFTPHDVAASTRMVEAAKNSGAIVSIDIDRLFDGVGDLLSNVDILLTSADLPQKLVGIDDPRVALREMARRFDPGVAGVTLGEEGSLLWCGGELIETPGFAVPGGCRDTTGAGDAFRAGFLYGLLDGRSVEESARSANAVAALKCREIGARTSLPSLDELDRMLR
jgi:sugar/nucleoside kinase (ribokinase family)